MKANEANDSTKSLTATGHVAWSADSYHGTHVATHAILKAMLNVVNPRATEFIAAHA